MYKVGKLYQYVSWRIVLCAVAACLGITAVLYSVHRAHALPACPCHVFTSSDAPQPGSAFDDTVSVELGMRFKPQVDGYVTGVRFYKDPSMTDTHTGNLWGPTGTLLASGTFTNETSSGWQDLTFSSPVHVTAGTVYTASYYTPNGTYMATQNYFASDITNYPLVAPSDVNGVYTTGSDAYPNNNFQKSNYWVDVTFRVSANGNSPQVSATFPANGATGVFTSGNLTVTFDQAMQASTISTATLKLTDSQGSDVPVSVSYNAATNTATLTPSQPLAQTATYIVSVRGGSSGVINLDGTALATDYQTSFTTGSNDCPCSVWGNAAPSGSPTTVTDSNPLELGVSMHANENGYLQAVRFYKPLKSTATSHAVHVWASDGTPLATATSSHETDYGWQEVKLTTPVAITQGTDYIVSYYDGDNTYTYTANGLVSENGSGPLRTNAGGGRFTYNGDVFPTSTYTTNYWVDAVFTTQPSYTAPFTVAVSQPLNEAYGVKTSDAITLNMTGAADASTVTGSVTLKDAANHTVSGTLSYSDAQHQLRFSPTSSLSAGTAYTLTLSSTLKDTAGTAATPYTLHFTTGTALSTDINQGLGGPVLILTNSANPYGTYLAEMLRTEGINYFTVKDVSQLSANLLSQYRMVLLAQTSLSASQVTMLSTWVHDGGDLIAMRPDKQLASLLGLTDQNQTLSEGYLKVDTSVSPGTGVTAETMQYHGAADTYTAGIGTQVVATLFSNAATPTTSPAVTETAVGSGHAAAFTYDLPKSIALTHQGNPAWVNQDRDGDAPVRPNDLFDGGGSATDWLNTAKAHIPQADEQQQLLVNMMLTMDKPQTPLPRFWILPHGYKSAVVMTEDDHGTSDTSYGIFNDLLNVSATNCSVVDWQCARGGSLLYTSSGLTSTQANTAQALGFAMGVHVQTGCNNSATYADLSSAYTTQIAGFKTKYPGLVSQTFDRTHCYVWSGWDWVPKVNVANGMRINYNYEWYPQSWVGSNTGYLTGSGLNMRFTDASGSLLDSYQGVTDLDYETDATNATMNTDFDNTINSNAFYGVLGTHYDTSTSNYYQLLIAAATSRGIPLINASQLASWKDALGSSTFSIVTSSSSKLTFNVLVAEGGQGMQAMVPTSSGNGAITSLQVNGTSVAYTNSTVKGVSYAVFSAQPGNYTVTYGTPVPDTSAGGSQGKGGTAAAAGIVGRLVRAGSPLAATITNPSPFSDNSSTNTSGRAGNVAAVGSNDSASTQRSGGAGFWKLVGLGFGFLLVLLVGLVWIVRRRRAAQY